MQQDQTKPTDKSKEIAELRGKFCRRGGIAFGIIAELFIAGLAWISGVEPVRGPLLAFWCVVGAAVGVFAFFLGAVIALKAFDEAMKGKSKS